MLERVMGWLEWVQRVAERDPGGVRPQRGYILVLGRQSFTELLTDLMETPGVVTTDSPSIPIIAVHERAGEPFVGFFLGMRVMVFDGIDSNHVEVIPDEAGGPVSTEHSRHGLPEGERVSGLGRDRLGRLSAGKESR